MQRDVRLLISAIALGVSAVAMFFTAGAFFNELRNIHQLCAQFGLYGSNCYVNQSIWTSAMSYRVGVATFTSMGLGTWSAATYIAFKWHRGHRAD